MLDCFRIFCRTALGGYSDSPLVDSRVELYKIRLLRLPQEKEQLILGGNILRLLGKL